MSSYIQQLKAVCLMRYCGIYWLYVNVLTYVTVVLLLLQVHVVLSDDLLSSITCMMSWKLMSVRQVWQVSNVSFYAVLVLWH